MQDTVWYTRRGREIRGPYPEAELKKFILLGRVSLNDQLSTDQFNWRPLSDYPELIPVEMRQDLSDPQNQNRLNEVRESLDERGSDRREQDLAVDKDVREGGDRRKSDNTSVHQGLIQDLVMILRNPKDNIVFYMVSLGFFLACALLVKLLLMDRTHMINNDCLDPPAPKVNWNHCVFDSMKLRNLDLSGAVMIYGMFRHADMSRSRMHNADMSYSNFSGSIFTGAQMKNAKLVGAILHSADFSGADLSGATLSTAMLQGADFRGARLKDTNLSGTILSGASMPKNLENADLSGAIWVDNTFCAQGSVGRCIPINRER